MISAERLQNLITKSGYMIQREQMTACVFGFLEPILICTTYAGKGSSWIIFRIAEESVQ